jgi:hypothetical protein
MPIKTFQAPKGFRTLKNVNRKTIDNSHKYKQKIEKAYILKQMIVKQQETKVNQNEKIQEVC